MLPRILLVNDNHESRTDLKLDLESAGFEVRAASPSSLAVELAQMTEVDLILIDLSISGFDTCRELRDRGDSTPIIILSEHRELSDEIAGLDVGADDYVVKPIVTARLTARIRALLRRSGLSRGSQPLRFLDLELDPATLIATRGALRVHLTRTEFALLYLFMRNPNRVLSHSEMQRAVWGHDFGDSSNSPEIYVGYLRRKLEAGGHARVLHTIRGSGYVLSEGKPS